MRKPRCAAWQAGCRLPPLPDRGGCAEHEPVYRKVRAELGFLLVPAPDPAAEILAAVAEKPRKLPWLARVAGYREHDKGFRALVANLINNGALEKQLGVFYPAGAAPGRQAGRSRVEYEAAIVEALADGELTVTQLAAAIGADRSSNTFARAKAALREAGRCAAERRGQAAYWRLTDKQNK